MDGASETAKEEKVLSLTPGWTETASCPPLSASAVPVWWPSAHREINTAFFKGVGKGDRGWRTRSEKFVISPKSSSLSLDAPTDRHIVKTAAGVL